MADTSATNADNIVPKIMPNCGVHAATTAKPALIKLKHAARKDHRKDSKEW